MTQHDLTGKVAIVTGAARGIGSAIAERLAAEGAHVVVAWGHSSEAAGAVVARIAEAGGSARAVQADMGDGRSIRALFADVDEREGGIDIVVANAGIGVDLPIAEYPEELFDETVRVNLRGTFLSLQESARRLRDHGRVITISSGYTRRIAAGAG